MMVLQPGLTGKGKEMTTTKTMRVVADQITDLAVEADRIPVGYFDDEIA